MSDETGNPEDFFRHIFGLPDPETVQRQNMVVEAQTHEVYNWFNTADEESLKRVKTIIGSVINAASGHSGAAMQAAFWQGFICAKLEDHHTICPACGVNHMEELKMEFDDSESDS